MTPDDPISVSAREHARAMRERARAIAGLEAIEELHEPAAVGQYREGRCEECDHLWPCDTRRLADEALL